MSLMLTITSHPLVACAACYGQSDSPLAKGMNWGIVTLLGTILLVLGGIAAFFVSLARRSAALSATAEAGEALSWDQAPAFGAECRAAAMRSPRRVVFPRSAAGSRGRLHRRHVRRMLDCAREASAAFSRFLCSKGSRGLAHARRFGARQRPGSSSSRL